MQPVEHARIGRLLQRAPDRHPAVELRWLSVDEYVGGLLAPHDDVLDAALGASEEAGLPSIQVSPPQGKLLYLLAKAIGAKRILEFGTLGAYSTIWLGRALPADGRLITLEVDAGYAEVARANIARASLEERIDLKIGPAQNLLESLDSEEASDAFDLAFIDADKVNSPAYFAWCVDHVRPGGLIVADNVVRGGALADPEDRDPAVRAQRTLHEMIAAEPRVSATTIQTVGAKGYDGFTLAVVEA